MTATSAPPPVASPLPPGLRSTSPETLELARREVRKMLESTAAFQALPPDAQREIAKNTVAVVAHMAEPGGVRATAEALAEPARRSRSSSGEQPPAFVAQGAREGAAVAGALLEAVNFPTFVASLVKGVFHAIVQSSIEQMEAYGRLVADVAKSLNEFRDENVSANQGRDHLVDQFPDIFEIAVDTGDDFFGEGGGPRVQLRRDVDERAALDRIDRLPVEGGPVRDLSPETIEQRLVPAARTQLATSRQQLLATMVMMGINRIVVTDGRISAKVMYDFRARDNMRYRQSATAFDYDDTRSNRVSEGSYESDSQGGSSSYTRDKDGALDYQRQDGSYYSKGTYKTVDQPAITLMRATQTEGGASLETKASLAGVVDINFKSDYFPLEKLADSFQIARIQNAAEPATGGRAAPTAAAPATAAPGTTPSPAPGSAPPTGGTAP